MKNDWEVYGIWFVKKQVVNMLSFTIFKFQFVSCIYKQLVDRSFLEYKLSSVFLCGTAIVFRQVFVVRREKEDDREELFVRGRKMLFYNRRISTINPSVLNIKMVMFIYGLYL